MKKNKKNNFPVYLFGGKTTDDLLGEYLMQRQLASASNPGRIQNPNEALTENNLVLARAEQKSNNNILSQGLDIFGSLALQAGGNMMNKGIANGETFETGGKVKKDKKKLPKKALGKIYRATNEQLLNPTELMMELFTDQIVGKSKPMPAAMGGKVPVEAEGEELVETPDGGLTELVGPSHENGGIELLLPEGTEIFSKRLKGSDGKTMAQRKKSRERQAKKMQKLYDSNPTDNTLKKTLEKTLANNEAQEQIDVAQMEEARQNYNAGIERMMGGLIEHMATGGKIYKDGGSVVGNFLRSIFGGGKNIDLETGFDPDYAARQLGKFTSDNASNQTGVLDSDEIPGITDFSYNDKIGRGKRPKTATTPFNIGDMFGEMPTLGDGIGIVGNLISTFGPKKNTLANRAGDTPNINAFEDYGKEGLEVLDSSKQYIAGQRDNTLQDLELSRSSAIRRGRNSARGINTQRALDIATNASINDTKSKVYNNFASQMMNILSQQAGMENQQDQIVMRGEQARDLADRQDRDNFYSQLAQDIATQGTGLQHLGKNVNSIKQRGTMSKIFADLFENYAIDPKTGKTKFKKG